MEPKTKSHDFVIIVELHVEAPEEVTEGETADLTCNTTCSLTDPTFIWYKDGRPLTTKTIKNNQLHLQTVSSEDAGSYSCAVRGSQHLNSTAHRLRVRYPPKNVSVSISSSGEIVKGSSVTLTCSSDGNPPVKNYTWFKEAGASPVGSGHRYSPLQSGSYYCEAQNQQGAQRSDPVPVILKGYTVILYAAAGVGLFGVAVSLTIFFRRRKKRQTRNMNERDCGTTGHSAKPPDDDSDSANIYENITNTGLRAPPPDDDSSSADVYENIPGSGFSAPPPEDNSFSVDDYDIIPGSGLSDPPPHDDSFSGDDYENTPGSGLSDPPPYDDSSIGDYYENIPHH
ncbi:hypothetical protein MHYP_G00103070 [Metynnis hypsauchen]